MVESVQAISPYDLSTNAHFAASYLSTTAPSTATSRNATPVDTKGDKGDTVTLSASAQASQLYLQGNSVSQIAALLGLPQATVESDLNITASTSTAATSAESVQSVSDPSRAGQTSPATALSPYNAASTPVTAATASTVNVS